PSSLSCWRLHRTMRLMRVAPMESAYGWYSIAQRRVEQCLPLSVGQRSDATSPHQFSPAPQALSHVRHPPAMSNGSADLHVLRPGTKKPPATHAGNTQLEELCDLMFVQ